MSAPTTHHRGDAERTTSGLWVNGNLGKHGARPRLLFGQVREDARVEVELLGTLAQAERVFSIASAGCTAFSLLAQRDVQLSTVDVNPAQIHLTILKREVLCESSHEDALFAMNQSAARAYWKLRSKLPREARAFWDEHRKLLDRGLHRSGAVDAALERAMFLFRTFVHGKTSIEEMLGASPAAGRVDSHGVTPAAALARQRERYATSFDSARFRAAISLGLSRPLLRVVYGEEALRDLPHDFAAQMKRQLDEVFTSSPIGDNGHLWQLFLSRYPDCDAALPPYLQRDSFERVRRGLARADIEHAEAGAYLRARPGAFDFLALSNVLEVSTPGDAASLLDASRRACREGALVCLRSIFPPRGHVAAAAKRAGFVREPNLERRATEIDRSPFCRHFTVLRAS